jgi:hypothetical protein
LCESFLLEIGIVLEIGVVVLVTVVGDSAGDRGRGHLHGHAPARLAKTSGFLDVCSPPSLD